MLPIKPIEIVEIKGGFKVPTDTHLGKWQVETQKLNHDEFLPALVCSHLKAGQVVIDCGAFNGDHAIAYSSEVMDRGMVVCIEAGKVFELLKYNISLLTWPHKNTFALHAALSESCGEDCSHIEDEEGNLGASVCTSIDKKDLVEGQTYLKTVTIDYVAMQLERPVDFIKIDCEGWETKILIGASKTLQKDRPKMLIEINRVALENQGSNFAEIQDILAFHEYDYSICQPECTEESDQFDILCIPRIKLILPERNL